ncbi:cation efflux protein [Calycina marina]|uniref:Cation efflux protein n=1 Tax=Calycina marina TaxID=1763456 RepID=A0A9P7Z9B1_9HELO|nr:cation efflux protein [Calycina marina]
MAWSKSTRITIMLVIDGAFFVLELGVGLVVGSLALMADAFHMLNDIISLAIGLWAVKASQKSSTDKYTFGWLRAEILGAFFNAVFLIALCLSIVLEAITRLINPPVINQPLLILIVGSLGLASNLAGFFVLSGHGHSHGPEGNSHDELGAAEEGNSHVGDNHVEEDTEEESSSGILPEVDTNGRRGQQSQLSKKDDSMGKLSPRKQHRRITSIDQKSIHPASFRQEIISLGKSQLDDMAIEEPLEGEDESGKSGVLDPTENTPLLTATDAKVSYEHGHAITHVEHNHNKKAKEAKGGHSHNHADMGMNAMILHVIGDALGNVGVIVSALIIMFFASDKKYYADPAVSLFITSIILKSTVPLTKATAKILLQATPDHIDVNNIKQDIQLLPGVISCHHVHIWQLSDTQIVASMHIQVEFQISEENGAKYMDLARAARKCLHAYDIHSATIQPEFSLRKDSDYEVQSLGLDGIAGQPKTRLDDDCLLECVDDCKAKGCCSSTNVGSQASGSGSQHSDRDHDHDDESPSH